MRTATISLWVRLKIYPKDYILIDVINQYDKIHPCIIYSFVRITEWNWNFSKIFKFYLTLGFKPKLWKKLDRIDKISWQIQGNFVIPYSFHTFGLTIIILTLMVFPQGPLRRKHNLEVGTHFRSSRAGGSGTAGTTFAGPLFSKFELQVWQHHIFAVPLFESVRNLPYHFQIASAGPE